MNRECYSRHHPKAIGKQGVTFHQLAPSELTGFFCMNWLNGLLNSKHRKQSALRRHSGSCPSRPCQADMPNALAADLSAVSLLRNCGSNHLPKTQRFVNNALSLGGDPWIQKSHRKTVSVTSLERFHSLRAQHLLSSTLWLHHDTEVTTYRPVGSHSTSEAM